MAIPDLKFRCELESVATNPYLTGPIEVEASDRELKIRWAGESEWTHVNWHEILMVFRDNNPPKVEDMVEAVKDEARREMYEEIGKQAAEMDDAVYQKGYKDGFAAGKKIIVLNRGKKL